MPFVDSRDFRGKIGAGHESDVFAHKNKEVVFKQRYEKEQLYEWQSSPNYIKAEFYLTKLVHLLYPKNIPDILSAGKFSQVQKQVKSTAWTIDPTEVAALRSVVEDSVGIRMDKKIDNFVKRDNEIVYLDRISPWYVKVLDDPDRTRVIWYRFSKDKIANLIAQIADQKKKEKAENYWNSVLVFLQAEEVRLDLNSIEIPADMHGSSSSSKK